MDEEYFAYAKKINAFEDKIFGISAKYFIVNDNESINKKNILCNYSIGIEKYKECAEILLGIKAPRVVEDQHKRIIEELVGISDTLKAALDLYEVDDLKAIKEFIDEKKTLNEQVTDNIFKQIKKIGEILSENFK